MYVTFWVYAILALQFETSRAQAITRCPSCRPSVCQSPVGKEYVHLSAYDCCYGLDFTVSQESQCARFGRVFTCPPID